MRVNRFLKKLSERLVDAWRCTVAKLAPSWCINRKTLKSNPNAFDFMPSEKAQLKAVKKMSKEEMEARFWSERVLDYIFFTKEVYFSELDYIEFNRLTTQNRKDISLRDIRYAVKSAIKSGTRFTDDQRCAILNMFGVDTFINEGGECKNFAMGYVQSHLTVNGRGCEGFITSIASCEKLSHLYRAWLGNFTIEPNKMDYAYLEAMMSYLFSYETDYNYETYPNSSLKEAYLLVTCKSDLNPKCFWLSLAINRIDEVRVADLIKKYLNQILAYLDMKQNWKQELIECLINAPTTFKFAYELYERSSSKEKHIVRLCELASGMRQIEDTISLLDKLSDEAKAKYGPILVEKALNSVDKCCNGRPYTTSTSAELFVSLLKQEVYWNEQLKERVLRAIAAGCCMTDELFESLSEREQKVVLYEMEIFSQISLLESDVNRVITNKTKLHPEVEAYWFSMNSYHDNTWRCWREYIELYELSEMGYKALLNNPRISTNYVVLHAQKHGMTSFQYRTLLSTNDRRHLAPELYDYVRQ